MTLSQAPNSVGGQVARLASAVTSPTPTEKKASGRPPFYSAYVNRRLGYVVARALESTRVTPNAVTAASAAITFGAIALLVVFRPSWPLGADVAVLLAFGFVLDSADGQLARLRATSSATGEWFDHTVDCFKFSLLHLAVLVSFYRWPVFGHWILVLPLLFAVVSTVTFFGMMFIDQLRLRLTPAGDKGRAKVPRWRRAAVITTDYGLLCFSFALLGWAKGFVVLYGALLVANLLFLCWNEFRWFGEISRLEAAKTKERRGK